MEKGGVGWRDPENTWAALGSSNILEGVVEGGGSIDDGDAEATCAACVCAPIGAGIADMGAAINAEAVTGAGIT